MQTRILSSPTAAASLAALLVALAPLSLQAQGSHTETVILNVEGMWEQRCEEYIASSLLGDLEGVREVHADHANEVVAVEFDPAEVSAERIASRIENCPAFDVTGSETHELDESLIEKNRRSCCSSACRHRDA